MPRLPHLLVVLALLAVGALLGGSLYDTLVLAPNLHGGPEGLDHGRRFLAAATPANFFRLVAPASQILVLAALAASWRAKTIRVHLLVAFAALLIGDAVTFAYHYPRNDLMFTSPLTVAPERLAAAALEWQRANWLRVVLVGVAWLGTVTSMVAPRPMHAADIRDHR